MVGRPRSKPATHIIGGRVIEESSGTSPPGDPLDDPMEPSNSMGPSNSMKSSNSMGPSNSMKPSNTMETSNSTKPATQKPVPFAKSPASKQANSTQKRKSSTLKKPPPDKEISEHETDSDSDSIAEQQSDAESHGSASSASASTGITGQSKEKGKATEEKKKMKRGPYKKRQKVDAVASTPRSSGRLRKNPKVRLASFYANLDESSSEAPSLSSSNRSFDTNSIGLAKKEHLVSPPSPEIAVSISPKTAKNLLGNFGNSGNILGNSVAAGSSAPLPKTSAVAQKSPVGKRKGESDSGRSDDGKESRHFLQTAKNYFNEKPAHVKALVEKTPFHLWDFFQVATFISGIGMEEVAETVLKEQLDGECLFFFDFQTWKKFNVKLGPALKIVREMQTLKDIQRKYTLKKWYEDNNAKVEAELQRLQNVVVS